MTPPEPATRPLRISIVGGGIGGLTAALALRQQGHEVDIFERSKLSQETGAAIHLASNANGLLRRLGLHAEDIGAVECIGLREYFPDTSKLKYQINTKVIGDKLWAHPWHLVHRAHLHTKLREMVVGEGKGKPASLHLNKSVKHVDPEKGTIILDNDETITADLVVGADGVHSVTRASVPGGDVTPFGSGKSAFRFLIPTETLETDPETRGIAQPNELVMWIADDRRLIMYPCVSNKLMNFVGIHPRGESDATGKDWQEVGSVARMLEIYRDFHPSVRAVMAKAEQPKVWELLDMEKIPSFIHKKLVLLGDAAHPFLPHQGQGGGQAIEDALSLAAVLPAGTPVSAVEARLKIYQECRYERAHKIQDFTRMAGKDPSELAKEGRKLDMQAYQIYNFGHDAWDYTKKILRERLEAEDATLRFRSPYGFGPSPGPRQSLGNRAAQCLHLTNSETFTTYSVRFSTSRTYLEAFLPRGFTFSSPGTKAYASVRVSTLDAIEWLGTKGYSHYGLYIHGIKYTKSDGSTLHGTFLPVLFENSADSIIVGREEVGIPKLYADIDIQPTSSGVSISLRWRGTQFGSCQISNLEEQPSLANGAGVPTEPQHPGPSPVSPPPEQGLFVYRYVPAVGLPGKADAAYPVFLPCPSQQTSTSLMLSRTATVRFDAGDWQTLPTLHNVADGLAGIPIYQVEEAKLVKGCGVSNFEAAHRIE